MKRYMQQHQPGEEVAADYYEFREVYTIAMFPLIYPERAAKIENKW